MKKVYSILLLALVMTAGLTACSDSEDYQPASPLSGNQVFFPASNPSSYTLKMAEGIQTFEVTIARADSSEAVTIDLLSDIMQNEEAFSIPAQISFAENEAKTTIPVSYDATALGYDNPSTLSISISNEDDTTPYGISQYEFVATIPSPLKLLGTGNFVEGYWYGGKNPVQIYQNELNSNVYRIMNPFNEMTIYEGEDDSDGTQSEYVDITILQLGETLAGVQITMSDLIYYAPISTGYFHPTYGEYVYLYHPAHFPSLATEEAWSHNKVVDWQENGLPGRIQLAPYYYMQGLGGWNYTTADGLVYIDFPGYEPKDYSAELSYVGVLTDASSNVFAVGNLTLGEDAKTVKAVVVSASDDADAVAEAIAAGELDAVDVAVGRIEVPIAEGLTGNLQLVAVVFDDNKVKAVSSARFEYYGGGVSPWVEVGTGTYTYTAFFYDEVDEDGNPIPYEDGPLTIFRNSDDPTLYKVTDWGYGVDFTFTWDGEDGTGVTVPTSYTGYTDKQYGYGPIYVSDVPIWSEGEYTYEQFPCSYDAETSTFSFVVAYWDMVDPTDVWGLNEETLQVTWGDAAPAAARAAKAKNLQVKGKKAASNLRAKARKSPFANGKKAKVESIQTLKSLTGASILVK